MDHWLPVPLTTPKKLHWRLPRWRVSSAHYRVFSQILRGISNCLHVFSVAAAAAAAAAAVVVVVVISCRPQRRDVVVLG
jgi:hypothetical protein